MSRCVLLILFFFSFFLLIQRAIFQKNTFFHISSIFRHYNSRVYLDDFGNLIYNFTIELQNRLRFSLFRFHSMYTRFEKTTQLGNCAGIHLLHRPPFHLTMRPLSRITNKTPPPPRLFPQTSDPHTRSPGPLGCLNVQLIRVTKRQRLSRSGFLDPGCELHCCTFYLPRSL